jgi:hypothetical protein
MLNEWLTCEDLCNRWNINKYTVADMVNEGRLRTHDADFTSYMALEKGEWFEEQHGDPDGDPGIIHMSPISGDQITAFIFRRSDVEKFEKRYDIRPNNLPETVNGDIEQETPEGYIKAMRAAGKSNEEIAWNLHHGRFKLTYHDLISRMGLDDKEIHRSWDAVKKQGERLCKAWGKNLGKQKKATMT